MSTQAAPVSQSERITILDSLRGIAILGILLMNILGFGYSGVVTNNPTVLGETGINYYLWFVIDWFFDGTQRALFSILFGAGIILFISRQEKRTEGLLPADYFFRRQLWLMVFSVFDVFILLWNGDILLDYACYGMMLFTFRKLSPKTLLIMAGVCLLLMLARENREFYQEKSLIAKGEAVAALDTTQTKLTNLQKEELEAMKSFKERSTQESRLKRMENVNEKVQGSYASVYEYRTERYLDSLVHYLYLQLWDVLICMLIGMAFFKTGVLTGQASLKLYASMAVIGLGVGLTLSYFRIQSIIDYNFNWFEHCKNVNIQYYSLDRILRALGILGAVMVMFKSGFFKWFFAMLRPVGQMAFTNYLSQSLICTLLFSGFAFGLFGKLERYELYLVVLSIWLFQIILCNIWMSFFLYGPLEWAWRSLTYWKRQPFLKGLEE